MHVVITHFDLMVILAFFVLADLAAIIAYLSVILRHVKDQTLFLEEIAASSEDIAHIEEARG